MQWKSLKRVMHVSSNIWMLTCWYDAVKACLHLMANGVLRQTGECSVVEETLRTVGGNWSGCIVSEGGPLSGRLTARGVQCPAKRQSEWWLSLNFTSNANLLIAWHSVLSLLTVNANGGNCVCVWENVKKTDLESEEEEEDSEEGDQLMEKIDWSNK